MELKTLAGRQFVVRHINGKQATTDVPVAIEQLTAEADQERTLVVELRATLTTAAAQLHEALLTGKPTQAQRELVAAIRADIDAAESRIHQTLADIAEVECFGRTRELDALMHSASAALVEALAPFSLENLNVA
jgi:hypothetical protein